MNDNDFFINQLELIIKEYENFFRGCEHDDLSDKNDTVEIETLISKSIAAIERISGKTSEYYNSIQIAFNEKNRSRYRHNGSILKHIIGIVTALKSDLENNFLKSFSEIIHSELFSDYMEMASHLLEEGYKDPAAVLAGSTLENNLRKLCLKNSIEVDFINSKNKTVPIKADTINADLVKGNVYNRTYQKQITAWLDLRNNAAHGKYDEYKDAEVNLMIQGILHFMQQYPA